MVKRLFFLFFLTSVCHCLSAQSVISGKITGNDGEVVEFAPVMLKAVKDSSVAAYASTDENGVYRLTTGVTGAFLVQASCLGYAPQTKPVELPVGGRTVTDFDFVMRPNETSNLGEIIVEGRKTGIFFDGDTIRYDPKMFTDGTESSLGDVLNKLPGIEVDEKGNVKAHGKRVEKVLLNGRDFFDGNTQTAVKNLSADIAESVEVLNNYSEYSLLSGFSSHEQTVINVGVNKNKLGRISGNVSGGGGVENKYEAKGDLMQIQPKYMLSIIGSANNSGGEIFSIEDYFRLRGGVSEFTSGANTVTLSETEQKLLVPRSNVYRRNSGLGGMNFSYQPKNSLKLNSYLLYDEKNELSEERNTRTYLLSDGQRYVTADNQNAEAKNSLSGGLLKINWQPSPLWNVVYKGTFSNMRARETADSENRLPDRTILASEHADAAGFDLRQELAAMRSLNGHLFISDASFSYDRKPSSREMQSDALLLPVPLTAFDDCYFGRQNVEQSSLKANVGFSFLYRLNASYFLRTRLGYSGDKRSYLSSIYQTNPGEAAVLLPDGNLQNDYSIRTDDYSLNMNITKNRGFFRFKFGGSVHAYDLGTRGMSGMNNRRPAKLNPEMEVSLHFNDKHVLQLSGYESEQPLPVEAFLQGTVVDDYRSYAQNSRIDKLYDSKYSLALLYRFFNMYYNTMLFLTGGFDRSAAPATVDYYSDGLLTERNPTLSNPTTTAYARLFVSKGLGRIPLTLQLTGGYFENAFSNFSANKANAIKVRNTTGKFRIVTNYRRSFDAECRAELELIDNSSSFGAIKTQTVERYSVKLKYNFGKRFFANVEPEYIVNRSSSLNLYQHHLNAAVSYKLNNKTEINLSGTNVLNLKNYEWASVSYNGIYVAERNFRKIPGNVILKLNRKL